MSYFPKYDPQPNTATTKSWYPYCGFNFIFIDPSAWRVIKTIPDGTGYDWDKGVEALLSQYSEAWKRLGEGC
jgi:hypothetical protein